MTVIHLVVIRVYISKTILCKNKIVSKCYYEKA